MRVRGVGPVRISSNLKNTVHSLTNWREVGDFAEYNIEVVTPGDYRIILNYKLAQASGAEITVSVGDEKISGIIKDKQKLELGVISLKQGKAILRLEITDIPEGSSEVVLDKLRSIELLMQ